MEAIKSICSLFSRHRELTLSMAWQEIRERHAGQLLGFFWSVFYPIIFLGVYVFIFGFMFRARTGIEDDSGSRVLFLLSGLIPWLNVSEVLGRSANSIVGNSNLVKQVVFPIEVLPVKSVMAVLFNQLIFLCLFFIFSAFIGGSVGWWTLTLLPLAVLLQTMALVGIAYVVAAVAVFFSDIKELIKVFTFLGMFTTPILLRVEQVPKIWGVLIYLNPFSYMVWAFQDALAGGGQVERWWAWAIFALMSIAVFFLGHTLFQRLRQMFGNVL